MKHHLSYTLKLIALGMAAIAGGPAYAGTANGPYYATPSWDQKLEANTRFIVLLNWNSEAVLDRETGLVWEKAPSTSMFTWVGAQTHCNGLPTGARLGWRLPALPELASLVDKSVPPPGPTLPAGHPFPSVQPSNYWSATTDGRTTAYALGVNFHFGVVADVDGPGDVAKTANNYVWCVRGGQGEDPQ